LRIDYFQVGSWFMRTALPVRLDELALKVNAFARTPAV
jgi:hypothetical protein